MTTTLTDAQFRQVATLARERWGLALGDHKRTLVQSRLAKFLVRSDFDSVEDYLRHLKRDATEADLLLFFDILSTNTTHFFREPDHFTFLERRVYPALARAPRGTRVRFWSAACSDGSEPYTLAIHALENIPRLNELDFKILATDLSKTVLEKARRAVYPAKAIDALPAPLVGKYFEPRDLPTKGGVEHCYRVVPSVRRMVAINELNLMGEWPMRGPFDVVFLRNVMIYFDRPTRERLVARVADLISPGGYLIIGGAETFSGSNISLRTVQPSIYQK